MVMLAALPQTGYSVEKLLPVRVETQVNSSWCGFAAMTAILNLYLDNYPEYPEDPADEACHDDIGQCAVAQKWFNRTDCCPANDSNCGGWSNGDAASHFLSDWGIEAISLPKFRAFIIFRNYIQLNIPFVIHWEWQGGGGHNVTAVGYNDSGGKEEVIIMDPTKRFLDHGYVRKDFSWLDGGKSDGKNKVHNWTNTIIPKLPPETDDVHLQCVGKYTYTGSAVPGIDQTYTYETSGEIVAGGDGVAKEFIITHNPYGAGSPSSGDVTFESGTRIRLQPGFQVEAGAEFHAIISP